MRAFIGILLFVGTVTADEKADTTAKKEREQFQGTWKVVSSEFDGKTDVGPAKDDKWVVKGDKITFKSDGVEHELTFKLNIEQNPKQIDLTPKPGVGPEGYFLQGIYKLEKDELVICYQLPVKEENIGKRRPSEFKTAPRSFTQIVTLSRTKSE
jgi:uncharacterized protein (TIGR03067 family)